jgi:hypothetical protein
MVASTVVWDGNLPWKLDASRLLMAFVSIGEPGASEQVHKTYFLSDLVRDHGRDFDSSREANANETHRDDKVRTNLVQRLLLSEMSRHPVIAGYADILAPGTKPSFMPPTSR